MERPEDLDALKQQQDLEYFKDHLMKSAAAESQDQLKSMPEREEKSKPSYDDEVKGDKNCRVELDKALQALKSLTPSRERSLAITKIQEGIMWLGMDLKRLGEANPYPNSYNPSNTKIEPTADGLKL